MQPLCIENIPINTLNVLAVDDEVFNLEILSEWLADWGINVDTAENGRHVLSLLDSGERHYHLILLDRMMPGMDGFELLQVLKQNPQWKSIPVVMQSASATLDEIQYAFAQGVWYYLCKPFERRKLYAILEAALTDSIIHNRLRHRVNEPAKSEVNFADGKVLEVKTLADAQDAAVRLARLSGKPQTVVVGLYELLLNAVEHGNLGISYSEKTRLLNDHLWQEEIAVRLQRSPYCDRMATIAVNAAGDDLGYRIKDQGNGFKSAPFLQLQTHRAGDSHGRGIAIANNCSFSRLEFLGRGNEVLAVTDTAFDKVA
jgi:CheY-like chemotaxis protein